MRDNGRGSFGERRMWMGRTKARGQCIHLRDQLVLYTPDAYPRRGDSGGCRIGVDAGIGCGVGPLIIAQEVSSANPQFRHLNVRHFLATFGGFCPTFLPTFWPFGPQICPKSAIDLQKFDFRPHFFVIFASGSVYGLEIALLRRGLELAVTFIFVDA